MNALLVIDNNNVQNLRVIVSLRQKRLKELVRLLLEEGRDKEAFDILKSKAEFRHYLPHGKKLPLRPDVTLFEDML